MMSASAEHSRTALTLALFAADPLAFGGIHLRGRLGPSRDAIVTDLRAAFDGRFGEARIPAHVSDDRLLGGLDLAATLASGKTVAQRGILAELNPGIAVLPSAERFEPDRVAKLVNVHDQGFIQLERDAISAEHDAKFAFLVLDEGIDDEHIAAALAERLGLYIETDLVQWEASSHFDPADAAELKRQADQVVLADSDVKTLAATALALGVGSLRALRAATRAAQLLCATLQQVAIDENVLQLAAQLTLAHRAVRLPTPEAEPPPPEPSDDQQEADTESSQGTLEDRVLEATQSAMPPGLLAQLLSGNTQRRLQRHGKAGQWAKAKLRGRPIGTNTSPPRQGQRLNILATLGAAAPWQRVRARGNGPIAIRAEDFRTTRFKERSSTTTLFVVDASGSAAFQRLAEVKGAIELLLAECYVRRDQVALIAFRGDKPEMLLSPTRSLARAKRQLARLPGGGATPLAMAIDDAATLADTIMRSGADALVVFLTDGRGNVTRDGVAGGASAEADTHAAARAFAERRVSSLLVDTGRRRSARCESLAATMGADYLALPHTRAETLATAVQQRVAA